jgi:transcriptional regulator with XRE-family HTH domain
MPNHRGYSQRFIDAVRAADQKHVGVKLARLCIKNEVSVNEIARELEVTRATVYSWFTGQTAPRPAAVAKIAEAVASLRAPRP